MNVKRDDYRGLINQIVVAADKNLSEPQILSLLDTMQTLGWQGSYRVTVSITRSGNLPKNIYGHTLCLLEDEIDQVKKQQLQRDEWKVADEDCATADEFKMTMQCIGLLCNFNNSGELCTKFGEYLNVAVKYNHLLESLQKAKDFYTEQLRNGTNLKKNQSDLL